MKGLLILSNNCEDVEALATNALLKRAGFKMDTATFQTEKTVLCSYQTKVEADYLMTNVNVFDYDFLVIPGGGYAVKTSKTNKEIKTLIQKFYDAGKLIAAICAAPMFLDELGILKNKKHTVFPGCENPNNRDNLRLNEKVVVDGNVITGRSVGALFEFVYEIVKYLKGQEEAETFLKKIYF